MAQKWLEIGAEFGTKRLKIGQKFEDGITKKKNQPNIQNETT